jgi:hypothetical protein
VQGGVPNDDFIFGAIVLAIFLVCVFAAGLVLNRVKNARFARTWEPLRTLIGGTVVNDGGGAATSWLTGTYKGRSVCATISPGRNRYPDETGFRYNYFDVALLETPGKSGWRLRERPIAEDKALEQRLRDAGAMATLATIGRAEAIYDERQRKLMIVQEAGSEKVPRPEHFEAQLNILLRLAEINAAVN